MVSDAAVVVVCGGQFMLVDLKKRYCRRRRLYLVASLVFLDVVSSVVDLDEHGPVGCCCNCCGGGSLAVGVVLEGLNLFFTPFVN